MRTTHPTPLHIAAGFAVAMAVGAGASRISRFSSSPATARAAAGVSVGAGDWRQASRSRIARIPGMEEALARDLQDAGEAKTLHGSEAKTGSPDRLLSAIEWTESRGRSDAIGDGGRAVGILQVWPITVADANRIRGREEFTLADRLDPDRSRAIFWTITNHYSRGASDEVIARRWNAGPTGDRKACSVGYWNKVRKAMEETR